MNKALEDGEFVEAGASSPVTPETPETASADMPTDPTAKPVPQRANETPPRPDGWEGVMWDCERLFGCVGHEDNPDLSNVPHLIKQCIEDRNASWGESRKMKNWIHSHTERGSDEIKGLEDVEVEEPMLTMLKCQVPCDTLDAIKALNTTHCTECQKAAERQKEKE